VGYAQQRLADDSRRSGDDISDSPNSVFAPRLDLAGEIVGWEQSCCRFE
jgi:hypothetical protein